MRNGLAGRRPVRMCVGCRRVRPQVELLRLTRTPDGFMEPDPVRRDGGRGAYLCFREQCLRESLRRQRWAQLFRAPTAVKAETIESLRAVLHEKAEIGRPGQLVEGRW